MFVKAIRPHTKAWHAARLLGVGASESPCLFDLEKPGYAVSRYTLRLIKRGLIDPDTVFAGDRQYADRGLLLEPAIGAMCAKERGWKLRPGGYAIDDELPQMRASLDFIIESPTAEDRKLLGRGIDGPGCLQVKTVIAPQFHRLWTEDRAPEFVRVQVQQECAAAGMSWGYIAALVGGMELKLYPVRAEAMFAQKLRTRIGRFWQDCVLGDAVPPIDHSESSRLALRQEFTASDMTPGIHDFSDDPEMDEAVTEFDLAKAVRETACNQYQLAENRLNSLMADSKSLFTENWIVKRSITPSRRAITVKRRAGAQTENEA